MSKVELNCFISALLRVHDSLIHASLEAIPFEMISPYVRELMFLEQSLESKVPSFRIADFQGLSKERTEQLLDFDKEVSKFFSPDPAYRIVVYKTLRVLYQLTYGFKPLSADCCEEA